MSNAQLQVRNVKQPDLLQLVALCIEHAAYERAEIAALDPEKLSEGLFASAPRLYAWVAADGADDLYGYATATIDFSTWNARTFVHMDCLYVREAFRGHALGQRLIAAVFTFAKSVGAAEVQWQTPQWNVDAQRFYARLGATATTKLRYTCAPLSE
jgi:GNAT superfamily N-acetyltransferase